MKPTKTIHDTLAFGMTPPQSIEVEETILANLIMLPYTRPKVFGKVTAEYFYKASHQTLFAVIEKLEDFDLVLLISALRSKGLLEDIGGAYAITMLTNHSNNGDLMDGYVLELIEKYMKRNQIRLAQEIIKSAYDDTIDFFTVDEKINEYISSQSESLGKLKQAPSFQEQIQATIERLNIKAAKYLNGECNGVPSGLKALDRVTGGWQDSDLIIMAARPGMGKTSLMMHFCLQAATFLKTVLVFSLEMPYVQLIERMIIGETNIEGHKVRRGDINQYEWKSIYEGVANLEGLDIVIDDRPALSVSEISNAAKLLNCKRKVDLILIDYLQLIKMTGDGTTNDKVSEITRQLKALAKNLNVPVICLSQLSRAVESRGGAKRPMLSDLRDSGAIEQDADLVIFPHREDYYNQQAERGAMDIIIAKHRNGSSGVDVRIQCNETLTRFVDVENNF